jgi:uncharacterized protein YukE
MSEGTFDLGHFYDLTGEIERYLGWLRGNEAVKEWWQAYQEQLGPDTPRVVQGLGYTSTPYEPDLWVTFMYSGLPDLTQDELTALSGQLNEAADQAWHNGVGWAAGIGGYLRDICASFTRPQASYLTEAMDMFAATRTKMETAIPVNATELDVDGWYGQSHDEFKAFTEQLHDSMQQYAAYFAYAENWFAAAATLAVNTQNGLIPLLEEVRDALRLQLVEWAETQGSPMDSGPGNAKALEVLKVGREIIGFIPAADKVIGTAEDVVSTTGDILALFDAEPKFYEPVEFTVTSAETIYSKLVSTLTDKYLTPFDDSLTEMGTKSAPVRATINDLGSDFFPPVVNDARSPEWKNELED